MFVYNRVEWDYERDIRNSIQMIYGLGWHKSIVISSRLGLGYPLKSKKLNAYYFSLLKCVLDVLSWSEVRIKHVVYSNIKGYYDIKSYRGIRHSDSLPVRGQRTRTNASTKKRIRYNFEGV